MDRGECRLQRVDVADRLGAFELVGVVVGQPPIARTLPAAFSSTNVRQ
jgi:hypothetical protein